MNAARAIVLALLALSLPLVATGGVAAASADGSTDASQIGSPSIVQDDDEDADNDTPRHRNPDEYDEDGDLDGLESWLSGWMTDRLEGSAIELSEGEYELAREYVGEEYRDRFGQYVDVAGETDGESQEESFERARDEQERLTEKTREYRETKDEYEEAREEGDGERARELARELEGLAQEVDESSGTVRDSYDEIGEGTGADLSEADRATREVNEEVQSEQAEIRSREFVETDLRIEFDEEEISFLDPLAGAGTLQSAEGEPIANETVRLNVTSAEEGAIVSNGRTISVETDSEGGFDFEYRPTDLALSADSVTVRFVPDGQSAFLGSETNASVSVDQVDPEVRDLDVTEEAAYGDRVRVSGAFAVDDVPIDGVTLDIVLDGRRIGTVEASNGTFEGTARVPASIPDGDRELGVRLSYDDRALAGVTATEPVTVLETDTALSVEGEQTGDRELLVEGALETTAGDPVDDESVQLRVDGTTVATVSTESDGTFEETVSLPSGVDEGDVRVVAVYEGAGSNLADSRAETAVSVTLGDSGSGGAGGSSILPVWAWAIVGIGGVAAIAAGVWWYRRDPIADGESDETPGAVVENETDEDSSDPEVTRSLLERAREQLSSGRPDEAVRSCYAAVRRNLSGRVGSAGSLTHWEFYRRVGETGDLDRENLLREVTEGYERATFGVDGVSADEAEGVVDRARRLCGFDEERSERVADD